MRARCRFSTNRINYIRQRHHNKVYDFVNPILLPGFYSFPPYLEFLSSLLFLFFPFLFYTSISSHSQRLIHTLSFSLLPATLLAFSVVLFNFIFVFILFSSGVVRLFVDGLSANSGRSDIICLQISFAITERGKILLNENAERKYMFT